MRTTLSRLGFVLCFAGILLSTIASIAHLSPPKDPVGAGAIYDEFVETYNRQIEENADANPQLSRPGLAKTRLQVHKQDTMFGVVAGGAIMVTGLMLLYFNRSKRIVTTETESSG